MYTLVLSAALLTGSQSASWNGCYGCQCACYGWGNAPSAYGTYGSYGGYGNYGTYCGGCRGNCYGCYGCYGYQGTFFNCLGCSGCYSYGYPGYGTPAPVPMMPPANHPLPPPQVPPQVPPPQVPAQSYYPNPGYPGFMQPGFNQPIVNQPGFGYPPASYPGAYPGFGAPVQPKGVYLYPTGGTTSFYSAAPTIVRPAPIQADTARLAVIIPEDGRLFINNEPTASVPGPRHFVTPQLRSDVRSYYLIRLEIEREGRIFTETRRVDIAPGQSVDVNFLPPGQVAQR